MNKYKLLFILFLVSCFIANPFKPLNIDFLKSSINIQTNNSKKKPKKDQLPSYEETIKDYNKIEGLFNMFWNEEKNKLLMEIKPEQHNNIFLANLTRTSGDGMYYDAGSMLWEFPFILDKKGKDIRILHINTLFRANQDTPMQKLIDRNFSNSIISTTKIISEPNKENGAYIVDANELFLKDMTYVSQHRKGTYTFDKKNSYFTNIQSYPENTEIDISAHFKSKKWTSTYTLPNSHSMLHNYHLSLSIVIDNDFISRVADDRIGYFTTIYQDYTNTLQETQYVRYINRWNLKKKTYSTENNLAEESLPTVPNINNTLKVLSEPVEPIVFWLENTIPEEFRQAVNDGVLAWNKAFEKIGFKNAIIAKQMPDDATWDPGDVRYNTIRWIVQPGSGYAVGPSRANPFTGEIYDADIRISADFVRAFYREYDEFITPIITDDNTTIWNDENTKELKNHCYYEEHLKNQMIFSWQSLISEGIKNYTEKELKEYVYKGLVDLVLHEVGHTLGLRHNFKASSIFSVEELSNPEFTKIHGISGSVMDYHSVCLLDKGNTMFQTEPGPYDIWAIEYGYVDEPNLKQEELLNNIASQSNNPYLAYGTDEDAFGLSSRGIDPLCSTWDMSNDPIAYYDNQLDLVENLWQNILINFEKKGTRYQKIRSVFSQGIGEFRAAARTASKFIGGIHFSRNHIGDPGDKDPLQVVNPAKQRQALSFIIERIFHKNAFQFEPNLLNKLSPERFEDFRDYVWRMDRIDYPLHNVIKHLQASGLFSLFHPRRMSRLQDNELRYINEDQFTMHELFSTITTALWEEIENQENINSFRRDLQKSHINLFENIIINDAFSFPNDAKMLARYNLKTILKKIYKSLSNQNLNEYTKAHLENSAKDIELILEAKLSLN